MAIKILIADDHRLLRAGLKNLLDEDPHLEVVGEATNGDEVLQAAQALRPDIILLDINMPGTPGLETVSQLIESVPGSKVLVLTMFEDRALVQGYLRAGAAGYITKRAAENELVDAIHAVQRGMIYLHPSLMQAFITPAREATPEASEAEALTAREVEILQLIVRGNTNRQIAEALTISVRTVETHRANLMDKLNLHSRVELVRYAVDHGLVKLDDDAG